MATRKSKKQQTPQQQIVDPGADPDPSPAEPTYDAALAMAAFTKIAPRLRAISRDVVETPNADIPIIITRILKIADAVAADSARFAALPDFDASCIDDLGTIAWALWHTRVEYLAGGVNASGAQLPTDLVQPAQELRARMLRVLEYHFVNDEQIMAELASIRQGSGYLDLAMDLSRLGRLYHLHDDVLSNDKVHWRDKDQMLAINLAEKITQTIKAAQGTVVEWADMQARAWTLLRRTYDEIAAAGRFLYRQDDPLAHFPPLNAMQPRARTARKPAEETPAATPQPHG
jgi:hypothetical protein